MTVQKVHDLSDLSVVLREHGYTVIKLNIIDLVHIKAAGESILLGAVMKEQLEPMIRRCAVVVQPDLDGVSKFGAG